MYLRLGDSIVHTVYGISLSREYSANSKLESEPYGLNTDETLLQFQHR